MAFNFDEDKEDEVDNPLSFAGRSKGSSEHVKINSALIRQESKYRLKMLGAATEGSEYEHSVSSRIESTESYKFSSD